MIKSMTGFGKANISNEKYDIYVEIKSVNSKYFDLGFRISKLVSSLEITSRQLIQDIILRGKVDVRIEINMHTLSKFPVLNKELILEYKRIFNEIAELTRDPSDESVFKPRVDHFLRMQDVIDYTNNEEIEEELENATKEAIKKCLNDLDLMREKEGKSLENDIIQRLNNLSDNISKIENAKEDVFNIWKEKFIKKMEEIGVSSNYEERIVQEASILGEKADITEEIIRLKSHIVQFKDIMKNDYPAGKKLDFLCQEIHRELNTIASKSSKNDIIKVIVESKAESDRIREQVQNII